MSTVNTVDTLQAMLFAGIGFALGAMDVMDSMATAVTAGVIMGCFSGLMGRGTFLHRAILTVIYVGFAVIGGTVF